MLSKTQEKKSHISFCNKKWRDFIKNVCDKIDKDKIGLQVISPFGFELLENHMFLGKSIKRLYCYIGIPQSYATIYDISSISRLFSAQLMMSIHEAEIDPSDIAILVIQDKFHYFHENNYQCQLSDKLLDVQARVVKENILHDYAKYIICTIDSIYSKKDEPKHFLVNKRHRCRTYQLYVMLEKVFGYLLPSLTIFQNENFSGLFKLIDNSIQMFYTRKELFIDASEYETHLLHSLIYPRVELMRKAIQAGPLNDLLKVQCEAYHVEGKLEVLINKIIYQNAINKICSTYTNFC